MNDRFENYIQRLRELGEDSPIAQAMIEKLNGRSVQWEGLVENVSFNDVKIYLWLKSIDKDVVDSFYALVPESQRSFTMQLRKGELVRASGTLILRKPTAPKIMAVEIERV